jgi:hypothetical protein
MMFTRLVVLHLLRCPSSLTRVFDTRCLIHKVPHHETGVTLAISDRVIVDIFLDLFSELLSPDDIFEVRHDFLVELAYIGLDFVEFLPLEVPE